MFLLYYHFDHYIGIYFLLLTREEYYHNHQNYHILQDHNIFEKHLTYFKLPHKETLTFELSTPSTFPQ